MYNEQKSNDRRRRRWGGGVLRDHGKQELAEVLASPHTGQITPSFCEKPKFRCSVSLTIKNNKEVYIGIDPGGQGGQLPHGIKRWGKSIILPLL